MRRTRRVLKPLAMLTVLTATFACGDGSGPKPLGLGQYVYTLNQNGQHVTHTGMVSFTENRGTYYQYSFEMGDSLRVNVTIAGQDLPDTVSRYGFVQVCQSSPSACFSLYPPFVGTSPSVILVSDSARSALVLTPLSSSEIDGSFDIVEIVDYVPGDSLAGIHGQFRAEFSGHSQTP